MKPRFSPDYDFASFRAAVLPARSGARRELERQMAATAGHAEGICFRYGRSGLYYLLRALGAKNKKVVLPAYTCVVVAHAIVESGNIPVFLDNAEGSFQPSPQDYLAAVDADTVMVIPTHLFGMAEETRELYAAMKRLHPHVFVLQDCAHSFFCEDSEGQTVTTHGDGALFGMNISKLVNTVQGGCLTLRDAELANRVRAQISPEPPRLGRSLRARAYVLAAALAFTSWGYELVYWLARRTRLLSGQTEYFSPEVIELPKDFQEPLTEFEATIGLLSLQRFASRIRARRELASVYLRGLSTAQGRGLVLPRWNAGNTWSHFPVRVLRSLKSEWIERLEARERVEIGEIVDYSIPDLAAYRARGAPPCPRATLAAEEVLNLPLTFGEGLWPTRNPLARAERVVGLLLDQVGVLAEPPAALEPALEHS